jgi:hypothetical protein
MTQVESSESVLPTAYCFVWIPLILSRIKHLVPLATFVHVYDHIITALTCGLVGVTASTLPLISKELAIRLAFGIVVAHVTETSHCHVPWRALAQPPVAQYLSMHYEDDLCCQLIRKVLIAETTWVFSRWYRAIRRDSPLETTSNPDLPSQSIAPSGEKDPELLLAFQANTQFPFGKVLISGPLNSNLAKWNVATISAILCSCATMLRTSALSSTWHTFTPEFAQVYKLIFTHYVILAKELISRVLIHDLNLRTQIFSNQSNLKCFPIFLTCSDRSVRTGLNQLIATHFDTQSQFLTRKQLILRSSDRVIEIASLALLTWHGAIAAAGVVLLPNVFPLLSWCDDLALMPSKAIDTTILVAIGRYLASFYRIGLAIGNDPRMTDEEYELFEVSQGRAHESCTALFRSIRSRITSSDESSSKWPLDDPTLGTLVDGLARWARVKDPAISQTIFQLLVDALATTSRVNIKLTAVAISSVEAITSDSSRKKSQFSEEERGQLFELLSCFDSSGAVLRSFPEAHPLDFSQRSVIVLDGEETDRPSNEDNQSDSSEIELISTARKREVTPIIEVIPGNAFRLPPTKLHAAEKERNNVLKPDVFRGRMHDQGPIIPLFPKIPKPVVPPPVSGSGMFAQVKLRKPVTKEELLRQQQSNQTTPSSGDQSIDEASARSKMIAGVVDIAAAKEILKSAKGPRKAVQVIDIPGGCAQFNPRNGKYVLGTPKTLTRTYHPSLPDPKTLERYVIQWNPWVVSDTPISNYPSAHFPLASISVPSTFADVKEYYRVFEPLIVMETWQQMIRSSEENPTREVREIEVVNVSVSSEAMDVTFAIPTNEARALGLQEMDVLCVYDEQGLKNSKTGAMPHQSKPKSDQGLLSLLLVPMDNSFGLQRPRGICTLAKISSVTYTRSTMEINAVISLYASGIRPGLTLNCEKLFSLVTSVREFTALVALPNMPLADHILNPATLLKSRSPIDAGAIQRIIRVHGLNAPQSKAVLGASHPSAGLSLIQGPPGTGKTKTILALVGTLLDRVPRVLVCAPSNAAVDELVKRMLRGIFSTRDGTARGAYVPNIIRVGNPDVIHPDARAVALDDLVDEEMQNAQESKTGAQGDAGLDDTWRKLLADRRAILQAKDKLDADLRDAYSSEDLERANNVEAELRALHATRRAILAKLDQHRALRAETSRTLETNRTQCRVRLLERAQIVVCTLGTAGQELFSGLKQSFDVVVVDEAAQAIELSTLIPLRLGAKQCILVGDPNQLPPTVMSREAKDLGYDQSVFIRIQKSAPDIVYLLGIQYRMHPEISTLRNYFALILLLIRSLTVTWLNFI